MAIFSEESSSTFAKNEITLLGLKGNLSDQNVEIILRPLLENARGREDVQSVQRGQYGDAIPELLFYKLGKHVTRRVLHSDSICYKGS